MAAENPQTIAKAICSKLKIVSNPKTSDIINSQLKMSEVIDMLPHFFSCIPLEINPKWVTHEIYNTRFPPRYLLVLGSICSVLGTHIYTKEILEPGEIEPKQCLILMGYTSEMIILKHLSSYLWKMAEGLKLGMKGVKGNGPKKIADREKEFYTPIYHLWKKRYLLYTAYDGSLKRFKKGLQSVIINHKFEYSNNKENPLYGGKLKLKDHRLSTGKWQKQKLLWCK